MKGSSALTEKEVAVAAAVEAVAGGRGIAAAAVLSFLVGFFGRGFLWVAWWRSCYHRQREHCRQGLAEGGGGNALVDVHRLKSQQ